MGIAAPACSWSTTSPRRSSPTPVTSARSYTSPAGSGDPVDELRKAFHHRLDEIHGDIVRIAALVTEAIPKGTEVLLSGDLNLADVVITGDDLLDARSLEVEEKCFQVLAL